MQHRRASMFLRKLRDWLAGVYVWYSLLFEAEAKSADRFS